MRAAQLGENYSDQLSSFASASMDLYILLKKLGQKRSNSEHGRCTCVERCIKRSANIGKEKSRRAQHSGSNSFYLVTVDNRKSFSK